ncbi:MAG: Ig-like domain repeat protein [Pyrinomonadaceae bacterium]|nr:Ig-like domain repeat protein [Pyrinomonadaceae bacterium]
MHSSLNRHLLPAVLYLAFTCMASVGLPSHSAELTATAATSKRTPAIRNTSPAASFAPLIGNTITVNSASDTANSADGLCTLREAITAANTDMGSGGSAGECGAGSNGGADTIVFTGVSGTIGLGSALPTITSEMSFSGPGLSLLTVSGSNSFRVFNITLGTGTVSFVGLTISNGRVMDVGGGIYNQNGADVNVTNSTISNNVAVLGGGIANSSTGTFTITNSTLDRNSAGTAGGCYNGSGTLNIINSTLSNNLADQSGSGNGGAINTGSNTLNIINSTLDRNTAFGGGGGIYNSGPSATINVSNSTLHQNAASRGGGAINNNNGGTVRLLNNIIAFSLSESELLGPFVSLGHNLLTNIVGSTGFTLGTNNPNGDLVGASFAQVFPFLGPLQNNGGSTQTRALLPGSPAIDAGDNCVTLASGSGGCLATPLVSDQRGVSRQVNSNVDMGAFESRGFTISAFSGTPQTKPVNTSFDPIVVTIGSVGGDPVEGGQVNFNSPITTGPTAIFDTGTSGISRGIEANGQARTTPRANGIAGGPYNAVATIPGIVSSASFSLTNVQAATNTAITSSSNPSDLTESVTFTATVTSTGTPTGTVQFRIDGANVGIPVSLSGGVATFSTQALAVGTHSVAADYSGDANFLAGSGTLASGQVVRPPPSLSINDVSFMEGDSGTKFVFFTVSSSASSHLSMALAFATADNTAVSPSDYVATSSTLLMSPGQTFVSLFLTVNSDLDVEADESFTVTLSSPVNATLNKFQGTATILNDDAEGGVFRFSQSSYIMFESDGQGTVTVNRASNTSRAVTVDYATSETGAPAACDSTNGIASHRCDFTGATGTLRFAAGETSKTFRVLVTRDSYVEGFETFTISLSNPTNGAALISPSPATVTIIDGATGPPANLIDDATVFVDQHYHDFLNRVPDPAGRAFWIGQITSCGSDAPCIEIKRINVSAAFFLSIEFQETGVTAFLTHRAAFGAGLPGYQTFQRDTQALQRGFAFGLPGSEAVLEANKVAFFNSFVQLPEFTAIYGSLTNEQYVDALITNTGVLFTASERDALVNGLNATTETRATVLRKTTEKGSFKQAQFNRAFVYMQYVGYLRRAPADPPDNNLNGFNFWLDKLNQFNGNFVEAEMVKAFIISGEYRQRFGP